MKYNHQINDNLEIQLATSQQYINVNRMTPITYIYYLVTVDGNIKYLNDLPNLDDFEVSFIFINNKEFIIYFKTQFFLLQ